MRGAKPALVINAGAYTAVDLAEKEAALARAVNGRAPGILAEEAKRLGAVLIHYSTDYVFDGAATTPYPEDAPTAPQNVYGATKLEGERAIAATGARALVFRTSWVYGLRGRNFLLTIRRLAAERDELSVVADQIGVPNWCRTLAEATVRTLESGLSAAAERAGLYHLSSGGHGELVRLRARDRRRCAAPAGGPDRDRRAIRHRRGGLPTACWRQPGSRRRSVSRCPTGAKRLARCLAASEPNRPDESRRSERETAVDVGADRQCSARAGDDDRVHAEGDAGQRGIVYGSWRGSAAARCRPPRCSGRWS